MDAYKTVVRCTRSSIDTLSKLGLSQPYSICSTSSDANNYFIIEIYTFDATTTYQVHHPLLAISEDNERTPTHSVMYWYNNNITDNSNSIHQTVKLSLKSGNVTLLSTYLPKHHEALIARQEGVLSELSITHSNVDIYVIFISMFNLLPEDLSIIDHAFLVEKIDSITIPPPIAQIISPDPDCIYLSKESYDVDEQEIPEVKELLNMCQIGSYISASSQYARLDQKLFKIVNKLCAKYCDSRGTKINCDSGYWYVDLSKEKIFPKATGHIFIMVINGKLTFQKTTISAGRCLICTVEDYKNNNDFSVEPETKVIWTTFYTKEASITDPEIAL